MMRKLTLEQIESARKKAIQNAAELLEDARLLFKNERWPRVLFLSQIAGEEIGKHILLSSLTVHALAGDKINWKRAWKRLTSHREKLEMITYMEDVFLEQPFPDDIKEYFNGLKKESQLLESFKQKSLYCDITEKIPHCPSEIITKKFAEDALKWAEGRYGLFSKIENELSEAGVTKKITKEDIAQFRKKMGIEKLFDKICG